MKFSVSKPALKEALARACGVAEARTTVPILANIWLQASAGALHLVTTDMDMEISQKVEAKVGTAGGTTLPCHTLHALVGKADADFIEIALRDYAAKITAGKSKFTLGALPVEDFPQFRKSAADITVTIESEALRRLLGRVQHAASSEETRYYLNGVMIHKSQDGVIRAVATDGHRLAWAEEPAKFTEGEFGQYIIPSKAVKEIRKLLDKPAGAVSLSFGDGVAAFEMGDIKIQTKLIDGTFPEYDRIIPKASSWEATVPPVPLRDAVERVSTVVDIKTKAVKLTFNGETLSLEAKGADYDAAQDEIAIKGDAKLEIGFNAAYLTETTAHFNAEFRLRGTDPASPVTIDQPDDPSYLYVLMPMRV